MMMMASIELWVGVGFVVAFFIGFMFRWLDDYLRYKFKKAQEKRDSNQ